MSEGTIGDKRSKDDVDDRYDARFVHGQEDIFEGK